MMNNSNLKNSFIQKVHQLIKNIFFYQQNLNKLSVTYWQEYLLRVLFFTAFWAGLLIYGISVYQLLLLGNYHQNYINTLVIMIFIFTGLIKKIPFKIQAGIIIYINLILGCSLFYHFGPAIDTFLFFTLFIVLSIIFINYKTIVLSIILTSISYTIFILLFYFDQVNWIFYKNLSLNMLIYYCIASLLITIIIIFVIISLVKGLAATITRLSKFRDILILGLAKLAEYRDYDTGQHLERIRSYTVIITRELKKLSKYKNYISDAYIADIEISSILHDIGKVGIPDTILLKPGRLTEQEFSIIKFHTIYGGDVIWDIEKKTNDQTFLELGKQIAYYHHEQWDGKGYPDGLKGENIPLSARIAALADVYDALTSKRCYKSALSHKEAVAIIKEERGRQFDPDVVDAFLKRKNDFNRIRMEKHN